MTYATRYMAISGKKQRVMDMQRWEQIKAVLGVTRREDNVVRVVFRNEAAAKRFLQWLNSDFII